MAVQLDETTAQLHELKLKQKQLEQRNFLLEKVAALNKQQAMPYADSSWLQVYSRPCVTNAVSCACCC